MMSAELSRRLAGAMQRPPFADLPVEERWTVLELLRRTNPQSFDVLPAWLRRMVLRAEAGVTGS